MLVLSRKPNEQIMIGEGIVITVVEIRGDKVRLGIEAPREVSVHRKEVALALRNERAHDQTHDQAPDQAARQAGQAAGQAAGAGHPETPRQ